MGDATIRCFIAIELPGDVQRELDLLIARLKKRAQSPDVKWVAARNIHLTLKFLGEVPSDHIDEVRQTLTDTSAPAAPMRLGIPSLGTFTSRGIPRVVWAGLSGDVGRLTSLAVSLDEALGHAGFERDGRPFAPHLTLARVRPDAAARTAALLRSAIDDAQVTEGLPFDVLEVSLMRSRLAPGGAIYSRLARVPLSGSPPLQ
jgi:RNA 2',3'-cyclic 3'-phosphodiesterase